MAIEKLVKVPFDNFATNQVIDSEQFDANFKALTDKVDEVIDSIDGFVEPTSENIDVLPFATLTANATLDESLQYYYDKLQSVVDGDSGGNFVKITPINGLTADDVQEALEEINLKTATPPNLDDEYLNKENLTEYIPTADYNPCTKKYADSVLTTFPYVENDYAQFEMPAGLYKDFDFGFVGAIPLEPFVASFSDSINECIFSCHCKQVDKVHMIIHNPTAINLTLVANTVRITKLAGIGSENNGGGGGGNITEYILSFYTNGADDGTAVPPLVSLTGGASYVLHGVGNMVKAGYTFYGWNTEQDGSGTAYIEGTTYIMPAVNTHLWAMWILSASFGEFVMEIDTTKTNGGTSTSTNMKLFFQNPNAPLNPGLLPNCVIDWGDGSIPTFCTSYTTVAHDYAVAGIYEIRIAGEIGSFTFGYTSYGVPFCKKVIELKQWGDYFHIDNNISASDHFLNCSNMIMTATDQPIVHASTAELFKGCSKLNTPINWDAPSLTNAGEMFQSCSLFNSLVVLSNAIISDAPRMFHYCLNFNQDVSGIGLAINTSGNKDFGAFVQGTSMNTTNMGILLNHFQTNSGNFVANKSLGCFERAYPTSAIPDRDLLYQKDWDITLGYCSGIEIDFTYDSASPYQTGDTIVITATFNGNVNAKVTPPVMQISCNGAQYLPFTNMVRLSATQYRYTLLVNGSNGTCTLSMNLGTYGIATSQTNNTFTIAN